MPTFTSAHALFLTTGLLLTTSQPAAAQAVFNIGPHLGGSQSTVKYQSGLTSYEPNSRLGWEAGLEASLQFKHFEVVEVGRTG